MAQFPRPYKNDTNAEDPIMKRVPFPHTDIGARASGMPKDVKSDSMNIEHVGGTTGKG